MNIKKSIITPLFLAGALSACGEKAETPNVSSAAAVTEESKPHVREYPFSDTHGECYAILQMRKHEYATTTKPENFDNARNYFENRIIQEFNLQGGNMLPGLGSKFFEYHQKLYDKYTPLELSQTIGIKEQECILMAVTEFTPQ